MTQSLRERFTRLQTELEDVARACGRPANDVRIIAVTKGQPAERIADALSAGLTDVGENYVQEAREKFSRLEVDPGANPRKHFIGHVQTNKAKAIAREFDVVQSVDRLAAGQALARAARELEKTLRVLVQVNISPSERFGCLPADAPALAESLRREEGLRVDGVMAIGPLGASPDEVRNAFAVAAKTFARVGGSTLSIGMSGDWPQAVQCGSTMIRIGTALFGQRPGAPPSHARK